MFKKLLSNLPYNPSLIGQVSFYAKRLHAEEKIRRLGLIFVVLAFVVQMFAFISRPQPTLAESSNDILRGGITSRTDAVNKCRSNYQDFATILQYYGVSCSKLSTASTINITSNAQDYDSLGRVQQGSYIYRPITGKNNPTDEYPVNINGLSNTLWMKNLRAWDSYTSSTYKVLKVTNASGATIMVLYDCGNIVTVGRYTPPPPPPPCKYNPAILASDPACKPPVCPLNPKILASDSKCVACPYNTKITKSDSRCVQCPYPGLGNIGKDNPLCKEPCPYNTSITKDSASCKPCEQSENSKDALSCLVLSKKARNNTKKIANADGTTAAGGDSITYTLSVKNTAKRELKNYVVKDNISDILDYADVTHLNGAKLKNTYLLWPGNDPGANQTINRSFTVKIKNPIPSTPVSSSDPAHFDLIMTNVYGNTVTIKLPVSMSKGVELGATTTLPNTGPGSTMAAVFGFTVFVSYFFARSRLFAKELDIVKTDYTTTGGY